MSTQLVAFVSGGGLAFGVAALVFGQPIAAAGLFVMSGLYAVAHAIKSKAH